MADSRFVYVTYLRTTPEKLWQALIDPEITRRYWCETRQESEWKPGSSWRSMIPDGRVGDSGEILEVDPHLQQNVRGSAPQDACATLLLDSQQGKDILRTSKGGLARR